MNSEKTNQHMIFKEKKSEAYVLICGIQYSHSQIIISVSIYGLHVVDNHPKSSEAPKSFYRRQTVCFFRILSAVPSRRSHPKEGHKACLNRLFHIHQRQDYLI